MKFRRNYKRLKQKSEIVDKKSKLKSKKDNEQGKRSINNNIELEGDNKSCNEGSGIFNLMCGGARKKQIEEKYYINTTESSGKERCKDKDGDRDRENTRNKVNGKDKAEEPKQEDSKCIIY